MIWIIIQFIFPVLLFMLPLALYKSKRRFMAKFYERMTRNEKARRFHILVLLATLLLFHYVYVCGHSGEFGLMLSTIVCAALSSFKRADRWLRYLLDRPRAFGIFAIVTMVIGFVPHLYTLSVTIAFILLAAMFYPSLRIISEWEENDINRIFKWCKHPEAFVESYHDNHHAKLPHETDSDNTIHPHNFHNEEFSKTELQ